MANFHEILAGKLDTAKGFGKAQFSLSGAALLELPAYAIEKIKRSVLQLQEFDLSSNRLVSLPENLTELRTLRVLRINFNSLPKLPDVVCQLGRLQVLSLTGNQLTDLNENIGQLRALKELDLSGNQLQSLPQSFCDLINLQFLNAGDNRLESLPTDFGELVNLERLILSTNNLSQLPESMAALTRLTKVDLANNHITRIPPGMGHITSIQDFEVKFNNLPERALEAHLQGVTRFLAFLRSEEERERQEEVTRMKPVAKQVGVYLEYMLKINEQSTARRGRAYTRRERLALEEAARQDPFGATENRCFVMSGAAHVHTGSALMVFGGQELKSGLKTSHLFHLNMETLSFNRIVTQGDPPAPRDGHSMVYDSIANRLVIFGGRNDKGRKVNDVSWIDLSTFVWEKQQCEGNYPGARENASARFVPETNSIVVFGGRGTGVRYNDLHLLDLATLTWSQPATSGSVPSPRQSAGICVANNRLWVHGGKSNFVLDDLYVFDFATLSWTMVETAGKPHPPRYRHEVFFHEGHILTFGGYDALGGQCAQMFKMLVPEDISQEHLVKYPPVWVEMDPDVSPRMHRMAFFGDGHLAMLQVGGRGEDEGVEEESWYNCFKLTALGNLPEREVGSDAPDENQKTSRVTHTKQALRSTLPQSFSSHTVKELKMLDYCGSFQRLFGEIYPRRRPLFLTPRNELGVHKLVCTTLRPSKLAYSELYNLPSCAHFVSEFIKYEPLENPVQYPAYLPSPTSVINWQAGDSFDMSMLLASLLLGVGYDAYVVVGYAPRKVCLYDLTETECPLVEADRSGRKGAIREMPSTDVPPAPAKSEAEGLQAAAPEAPAPAKEDAAREGAGGEESGSGGEEEDGDEEESADGGAQQGDEGEGGEGGADAGEEGAEEDMDIAAGDTLDAPGTKEKYKLREAADLTSKYQKYLQQQAQADRKQTATQRQNDVLAAAQAPPPPAAEEAAGEEGEEDGEDEAQQPDSPTRQLGDTGALKGTVKIHGMRAGFFSARIGDITDLDDPHCGRRVHAWVLVLPGSRDVTTPLYVEPSTGEMYPLRRAPYTGVEAVFNHRNFWVCMQMPQPHSDSRADPRTLRLDLSNPAQWERLFQPADQQAPVLDPAQWADAQPAAAAEPTATPRPDSAAVSRPGAPNTAEKEKGGQAAAGDKPVQRGAADMPPSWVPRLRIPREAFDTRCPRGVKTMMYKECKQEIFAYFGECARWDGMVERVTVYENEAATTVDEQWELFRRRKDALRERRLYPSEHKTVEHFDEGSAFGVKSICSVRGKMRETLFYPAARLDGLCRRLEEFSETDYAFKNWLEPTAMIPRIKTTEWFTGRDDFLEFRSVTYVRVTPQQVIHRMENEKQSASGLIKTEYMQPIAKVTERFRRNPARDADEDVAKRRFRLTEDEITLQYHYGEGRITRGAKLFTRDTSHVTQVDPLVRTPTDSELLEEYQALVQAERETVQSIRDMEADVRELLLNRVREEQVMVLVTPYFDIIRELREDSDSEVVDEEQALYDYLAPYLPAVIGPRRPLSVDEAKDVRSKVMKALTERLLAREAIIKSRIEEEKAALQKKQANFQRDRDQMTREEEEEYEHNVEESMFRLHILEQRLKRHQEEALLKFYELDQKLRADPRLAALAAGPQQ
ncbi:unnamed protein product [Pedinophyceae sp. YPF-701]|nr:unnamed protein product [Pedinophyceae sp. YPF-701]